MLFSSSPVSISTSLSPLSLIWMLSLSLSLYFHLSVNVKQCNIKATVRYINLTELHSFAMKRSAVGYKTRINHTGLFALYQNTVSQLQPDLTSSVSSLSSLSEPI